MTERAEVTGVLDALYAAALTDAAAVLDVVVGDRSGAAMLRSRADRTREAFELLWDEERGVYVDAADADGPRRRVSQQTIAMAVVSGCAPPERWDRVLDVVLDPERVVITPTMATHPDAYFRGPLDPQRYVDFDPERHVVGAQPFFRHFVHDALVRAGRRDAISESCRDWAHYLRTGHGTVEEFWDAPPGLASRCHVWAATPTYDLTTHMLGLRPLEPGWAEAGLEPRFGSFDRLLGRVPTPRGPIDVDLTPEGGTVSTPVPVRFAFEGRVGRGRIESGVHRLGVRR
jgi:hypothetical protein